MVDTILGQQTTAGGTHDVKKAITPLRLIFWGGLLCVIDFTFSSTVNGEGFRFDILNDALGMILITIGVFQLSAIPVHSRYAKAMTFVKVISVLALVEAVWDHFIVPVPEAVLFVLTLLAFAVLIAIVVFCCAMRWFCQEAGLTEAERSWKVTTILFVAIYLVPLGLLYLAGAVAILIGESFHIDLGIAGLLLVPVFIAPIIHLFVSTSRMKRGAENLPDIGLDAATYTGGGQPAGKAGDNNENP